MFLMKIGTAGWNIPKQFAAAFPAEGSHLERYSRALRAVEINSTFYKPHQPKTFLRWKEETPHDFAFSIKMTKVFTHEKRLNVSRAEISDWLKPMTELGEKFSALLVQLPPSLVFSEKSVELFFRNLRHEFGGLIALEPRNVSWIEPVALALNDEFDISKVEADPDRCPTPEKELNRSRSRYLRLHGSPRIYYSDYSVKFLERVARDFESHPPCKGEPESWIIFDNTTLGFGTKNAIELKKSTR